MPEAIGSLIQRAFSAGEITPAAWGHSDIEKYAHGLKVARNGFIMRQGGFTNRPGTAMLAPTKITGNGQSKVRLIPFVFSNSVAYTLEFSDDGAGNGAMRVYRAGAQISAGTPAAWSSVVAYNIGDLVTHNGGVFYCTQANTNQVPGGVTQYWYTPGNNPNNAYEIPTPYAAADLPNIQFVQARNVMYIACAGYPVYTLTCTSDTHWVFSSQSFLPVRPTGQVTFADIRTQQISGLNYGANDTEVGDHWTLPYLYDPIDPNNPVIMSGGIPYTAYGPPFPYKTANGNTYYSIAKLTRNEYLVTCVDRATGIESLPIEGSYGGMIPVFGAAPTHPASIFFQGTPGANITGMTQANPTVISASNYAQDYFWTGSTVGALGIKDGDTAYVDGAVGMTQLNGLHFVMTNTGISYVPQSSDSAGFPAYVSGGTLTSTTTSVKWCNLGPAAVAGQDLDNSGNALGVYLDTAPITLNFPVQPTACSYNIYKRASNGQFGFVANTNNLTWKDDGTFVPDTSKQIPDYAILFNGPGNYPSTIGMFQQRLCLGNTPTQQDWAFLSNTGALNSFNTSQPVAAASDTVQFEVAGQQYNAITQFVDNGFLLLFTQTGEFSCYGGGSAYSAGPITPTEIGLNQQAFYGASQLLRPICVGKNVLYLQSQGSKIRELLYNYYINGYSGTDMTVYSNHLFDGYTFVDWCYQQEPNSLVYAVRSDGVLLILTYIPELQLSAWTRCDTLGNFENVCAVPEGSETAVYCVVNRNGTRYVERFASRQIPMVPTLKYIANGVDAGLVKSIMEPDPTQFVFMDCSSFYDGRNASTPSVSSTTLTPTTGDFTANGAGFTMVASASWGAGSLVGQAFLLTDPTDGSVYTCVILAQADTQHWTCRPTVSLPATVSGQAIATWALGVNQLTGLDYLDGYEVSVLADGAVVSSPATETMLTITGGVLNLGKYYAFIRVGLPYYTDMRALDIDTPQPGQTSQDKPQRTNRVGIYVEQTRGLWAGVQPPDDDAVNPLQGLTKYPSRKHESMGRVPEPHTGIWLLNVDAKFLYGGGVFIRQVDPLPMSVESIVPGGAFMLGT